MNKTILKEVILIVIFAVIGSMLFNHGSYRLGYLFGCAAVGGLIGVIATIIKNHKGE